MAASVTCSFPPRIGFSNALTVVASGFTSTTVKGVQIYTTTGSDGSGDFVKVFTIVPSDLNGNHIFRLSDTASTNNSDFVNGKTYGIRATAYGSTPSEFASTAFSSFVFANDGLDFCMG